MASVAAISLNRLPVWFALQSVLAKFMKG